MPAAVLLRPWTFLSSRLVLLASFLSPVSEVEVGRPLHHCSEHWGLETTNVGTFQCLSPSPLLEVGDPKLFFFSWIISFYRCPFIVLVFSIPWGIGGSGGGCCVCLCVCLGRGGRRLPCLKNKVIWLWNLSNQKLGDLNFLYHIASTGTTRFMQSNLFQFVIGKIRMVIFIWLIKEADNHSYKSGFFLCKAKVLSVNVKCYACNDFCINGG